MPLHFLPLQGIYHQFPPAQAYYFTRHNIQKHIFHRIAGSEIGIEPYISTKYKWYIIYMSPAFYSNHTGAYQQQEQTEAAHNLPEILWTPLTAQWENWTLHHNAIYKVQHHWNIETTSSFLNIILNTQLTFYEENKWVN